MLTHPPITGRRKLDGEELAIYEELMALIVRLDLMGHRDAACGLVSAVEYLVDAPLSRDVPVEEIEQHAKALDAYHEAVQDNGFKRFE